jgi:DNA sulfur modification protein DndD
MILDKLTLRNFGLFRGKQTFNLAPAKRNGKQRPIVLFGGINGGGKTTLFDAIQLALYGSRARCSKRAALSYEDFLQQSVHHGIPPDEGAGVTLSFFHVSDGENYAYEVRRDWRLHEGKWKEDVRVLQDGLPNHSITRNWSQLVEELIPLEISQLFFFDGEKIRTLAEDSTSSAALGAAIKTLLGLDLVERLIADSLVVQTRLSKLEATSEQQARAAELEQQFNTLQSEVQALLTERASLENRVQRAKAEMEVAEKEFAMAGGRHWDERQKRSERLKQLEAVAEELAPQLLALSASELPLALVPELLERVEKQDERECAAAETEVVHRLLLERDRQLLEVLRAGRAPQELLQRVNKYLEQDRQARLPSEPVSRRLLLSEGARSALRHLRRQRLGELTAAAHGRLDKLAHDAQERDELARALAVTPSEADIAAVLKPFKATAHTFATLAEQAAQLDGQIKVRKAELEDVRKKLERVWQEKVKEEAKAEDRQRMIALAGRTRDTMQQFLHQATARKIDRLSRLITESFRYLLRKQTLVEQILIDPADFAITLYDAAGNALSRQRLSEGEKQIFAVAMLWGLARASARPLPAVIDTPMARLDAAHRENLVERYFPHASHQVLVFSTDTEVDRHYYELLQPAISRAYHLRYNEQERVTVGEEGYFWKE